MSKQTTTNWACPKCGAILYTRDPVCRNCNPAAEPCVCEGWASHDLIRSIITGHHENCPKAPTETQFLRSLIAQLVRGMECWGGEEDGIYCDAWPAYRKAKALLTGKFPPFDPHKGD